MRALFVLIAVLVFTKANECALTTAQKAAQGNCPSDLNAQTCLNDIVGLHCQRFTNSFVGTISSIMTKFGMLIDRNVNLRWLKLLFV